MCPRVFSHHKCRKPYVHVNAGNKSFCLRLEWYTKKYYVHFSGNCMAVNSKKVNLRSRIDQYYQYEELWKMYPTFPDAQFGNRILSETGTIKVLLLPCRYFHHPTDSKIVIVKLCAYMTWSVCKYISLHISYLRNPTCTLQALQILLNNAMNIVRF